MFNIQIGLPLVVEIAVIILVIITFFFFTRIFYEKTANKTKQSSEHHIKKSNNGIWMKNIVLNPRKSFPKRIQGVLNFNDVHFINS